MRWSPSPTRWWHHSWTMSGWSAHREMPLLLKIFGNAVVVSDHVVAVLPTVHVLLATLEAIMSQVNSAIVTEKFRHPGAGRRLAPHKTPLTSRSQVPRRRSSRAKLQARARTTKERK
eukprot:INCI14074.3.p3 GENE.INCI14074.3~~INCI14074.3.p3  ORF type:complete len:117 (+),score=3.38 INCI14074.3:199-549(+)